MADITKKISRDYGVLIEDGSDAGIALRGTFIIDNKGNVRVAMVNDLPIGRSVDEILRLVEAIQFNEKHGEGNQSFLLRMFFLILHFTVCPANWKKGSPTMIDDPAKSKKYFELVNAKK